MHIQTDNTNAAQCISLHPRPTVLADCKQRLASSFLTSNIVPFFLVWFFWSLSAYALLEHWNAKLPGGYGSY